FRSMSFLLGLENGSPLEGRAYLGPLLWGKPALAIKKAGVEPSGCQPNTHGHLTAPPGNQMHRAGPAACPNGPRGGPLGPRPSCYLGLSCRCRLALFPGGAPRCQVVPTGAQTHMAPCGHHRASRGTAGVGRPAKPTWPPDRTVLPSARQCQPDPPPGHSG